MALISFLIYTNALSAVFVLVAAILITGRYYYKLLKKHEIFGDKTKEINIPFLFFIGTAIISSILSDDRIVSIPLTMLLFFISFGIYNYIIHHSLNNSRNILQIYVNYSVFPAVIGIIQFILVHIKSLYEWSMKLDTNFLLYKLLELFGSYSKQAEKMINHQGGVGSTRIPSTFLNPNFYANYLIPVIILGVYFISNEKSCKKNFFHSVLLCVNVFLLFQTGSRAGLLGMCMGILFYVILRYSKNISLITVVIVALFLGILTKNPKFFPGYSSIAVDFVVRVNIWKAAYAYFVDHILFGIGLGTFNIRFYLQYGKMFLHAHSIYIGLLTELGILGFLAFSWWMFKIVNKSRVLVKKNNKEMMALWASFVGIFIQGIFDYPIYSVQTMISFIILLGITTSMIIEKEN